jgi:hypothetical protein
MKKIIISFLLITQNGVVAASTEFAETCEESFSKKITLVCDDQEKIEGVDIAFLVENFSFFKVYFDHCGRFSQSSDTELRIHGSVDDMAYLLASVRNINVGIVVADEPRSAISLLILADQLLLKKELMDCLKEQYGDAVNKELYSTSSYEKFLRGDGETVTCAWALDKKYRPAPIFEPALRHSSVRAPRSSALLPPNPRPTNILLEQPRRQSSFFAERSQREIGVYSFKKDYSAESHPMQKEKTFSPTRVKPTIFNKDKTIGIGFSATTIYVYDDAEHLLLEHAFSLGKYHEGYAIEGGIFVKPDELKVIFTKEVPNNENAHFITEEIIYVPSYESIKALATCTDEERYLYHALRSKVKEAGHKLDRLSLSSSDLEAMFDRLPRMFRSGIITSDGLVERVIAKQVAGMYGRMKQSSENKCRELQVYKP